MITLITGLPHSGKTTYAAKYENVIHLDTVPHQTIVDQIDNCCDILKAMNGDIVVEGVFYKADQRKKILDALKDCEGERVCVFIDTPLEVCLSRPSEGRSPVMIRNRAAHFEAPTEDEGWDEIIHITEEST